MHLYQIFRALKGLLVHEQPDGGLTEVESWDEGFPHSQVMQ